LLTIYAIHPKSAGISDILSGRETGQADQANQADQADQANQADQAVRNQRSSIGFSNNPSSERRHWSKEEGSLAMKRYHKFFQIVKVNLHTSKCSNVSLVVSVFIGYSIVRHFILRKFIPYW
jgi:hypothetical protein